MKNLSITKRLAACALSASVLLTLGSAAYAAPGDIVGHIYSTDILTYVNGRQAPSYNIGGKTAVIIEDMFNESYGIGCDYRENERTLYSGASRYYGSPDVVEHIYSDDTIDYAHDGAAAVTEETHIERGKVGEIVGDVYETNIKVIFSGHEVTCYNIGGKTAVCIEDLGTLDGTSSNEEYGFSKYLCSFVWDADNRTVSLSAAGGYIVNDIGVPSVTYYADNNVLSADYSPFYDFYSQIYNREGHDTFNNTEGFNAEKYIIHPLFLKTGDAKTNVGICWVDEFCNTEMYITELETAKQLVSSLKTPPMAYDDIIKLFDDGKNYKTLDRLELKDYSFLVVQTLGSEYEYSDIIYIIAARDGGFVNAAASSTTYTTRTLEKTGDNQLDVTVYPFGGPHGATSMGMNFDCEKYGI